MFEMGTKIRKMRKEKNLTQEQLAKRLGVTKSLISAYELSLNYPSCETLIQIASFFNTTTDYLLGREHKNIVDLGDLKDEDVEIIKKLIARLSK